MPCGWERTMVCSFLMLGARHCSAFKEADGTQGDIYYPLATMKDSKGGILYFGGTRGFTMVNPKKNKQ